MIPSPRHPAEVEARVFIALGSNLGDRLANLRFALTALAADCAIAVAAVSRLYETAPVGGPAQQGRYLNAAAALRAELSPHGLLAKLQAVEARAGRARDGSRDGPRELDLDLLDFEGLHVRTADLVLPHPRLHLRAFALLPLRDLAPDWRHPESGRAIDDLLAVSADRADARCIEGESLWPSSP